MVNIVQSYKVSCSTNVCGILTVNNVEKYIYRMLCCRAVASHKKMVKPVQQTWTLHHQCAKHTQHATYANARGSGGIHAPQKKFEKYML